MKIRRLKLAGFKSFVEPTELKIESGLTGIVGPNGCGKSNLLEALRWVMGEASAKSMRGGGMEDVIFAGTASRPPREFAEVTLLAEIGVAEVGDPGNRPAFFANDDDSELEVTRRIERGAGSAYRANGRDVRAKDVSLIFADAATGAHSPALVSQGRIGAIIAAKPQERRQMLEEAAGISGLHVRRKDAEQKLRAAENNLEKLSLILGDMEARASALKRQARQAERYKKLSGEINQAEARLIYTRWKEAKAAADLAKAEAATANASVEKVAAVQTELTARHQAATQKLAADRAAAMASRDAASDLAGRIIGLTGERDRILQRISDMETQAARIAEDGARESRLTHDAAEALARLRLDSQALVTAIEQGEAERPALERRVETSEKALRENELALARALTEQARAQAEQRVARSALAQAQSRTQRAEQEQARVDKELASLGEEASYQQTLEQAQSQKAQLEKAIQNAQAIIGGMTAKRSGLVSMRDGAQTELAQARAELSAFTSERDALERTLTTSGGAKAIEQITVQPGYERALAAALGDDADAPIGGDCGRRWADQAAMVPDNRDTLSHFVTAPIALHARLKLTIVADVDDGRALSPGQCLVTTTGHMRRWDGFVSDSDGATHAENLLRKNRLLVIEQSMPRLSENVTTAQAHLAASEGAISTLAEEAKAAERNRNSADDALRQVLRDVDRATDALERLITARTSLKERHQHAAAELGAAQAEAAEAQMTVDALPQLNSHGGIVTRLEAQGDTLRQTMLRTQSELSGLDQKLAHERQRRAVALADIRNWQDRAGDAEKRISEMKQRAADIAEEKLVLEAKPAPMAAELEKLNADKTGVAQRLAILQAAEADSEAALRILEGEAAEAAEALSTARETRAGAQARAENQDMRRVEMGRISGERFECPPPLLPEKLSFSEEELGDTQAESARLDTLQIDRERIGPVNLIAADELVELEDAQSKGLAENGELTQAISQLRGSIGSLNREGRVRLLEAFEAVDQHFRRLFTTLFNGGQAHLALIESDDPLEAGLEIFAQPPGKKLQSLTLLSGGEQALTAVALIFGLFLTNPAPICVLDEVDAPLDDANIERFCDLLDAMTKETDTRYLIVTHNAVTMSRMHRLFGVTMIEQGISRLVSVDLGGAEQLLAAE